jgi:hypothetical protein
MGMIAGVVLTLAIFVFMFWPEKNPFVQADKTRVDYLREVSGAGLCGAAGWAGG